MAPPKLPESKVRRIVELRKDGLTLREIGSRLGLDHTTVLKYTRKYVPDGGAKGEPPPRRPIGQVFDRTDVDGTVDLLRLERPATVEELMALCKLDPQIWIPQFFKPNVWQGWGKLKGPGGERFEKVNLYQSQLVLKRIVTEELEQAILEFVRRHVKPLPRPAGARVPTADPGFMVSWGFWDAHIGSYAWNSETGNDWDVDMACRRIFHSIDDMVEELRLYPVARVVMPVGNDFMHFDSCRMKTSFGEHFLDTDTRYARVYLAALQCLCYQVERALEIAGRLDVLYVPGNHDLTSSFTLAAALAERYREDPRVHVDLRATPRKYVTHGGVLLGFDHGSETRPNQFSMIVSTEAQKAWARSTYREMQVGDKHQRWEKEYEGVVPTNGLLVRRNPSLCNVDAWHHRQGLIGEPMKSVEAWRYDAIGYRGSHVTWARDDAHPKVKAAIAAIK